MGGGSHAPNASPPTRVPSGFSPRPGASSQEFRVAAHGWEAELALLQADLANIAVDYRQHLELSFLSSSARRIQTHCYVEFVPDAHGPALTVCKQSPQGGTRCAFMEPSVGDGWPSIS